jgi:hypothetical protein
VPALDIAFFMNSPITVSILLKSYFRSGVNWAVILNLPGTRALQVTERVLDIAGILLLRAKLNHRFVDNGYDRDCHHWQDVLSAGNLMNSEIYGTPTKKHKWFIFTLDLTRLLTEKYAGTVEYVMKD